MKISIKICLQWLLLGPVSAIMISFVSRLGFEYFSPGKLSGFQEMLTVYPYGLLMSLLTPWGWLMYGGLVLMITGRYKAGFWCSASGAVILGLFWPVWSTFLNQ